jgi:hypothetical protein
MVRKMVRDEYSKNSLNPLVVRLNKVLAEKNQSA